MRRTGGIRRGAAVVVLAAAAAGCSTGVGTASPSLPPAHRTAVNTKAPVPTTATTSTTTPPPPPPTVWVIAQNYPAQMTPTTPPDPAAFVPIDPTTGAAGTPLPIPAADTDFFGDGDGDVAIDPAGDTAYIVVHDYSADPELVPFNLRTGTAAPPIPLPPVARSSATGRPDGPMAITSMAFSPDGRTLYLTDAQNGDLIPVALATDTVGAVLDLGQNLGGCSDVSSQLVITPDGRDAYVDSIDDFIDVNLTTGVPSPTFHVSETFASSSANVGDSQESLTPDGSTLWVLWSGSTHDVLTPVNTDGDTAGPSITVPISPRPPVNTHPDENASSMWDAVYVPTDTTALVVTLGTSPEQVIPVDLATGTPGRAITLTTATEQAGCGPNYTQSVAITPDARTAVVSDPSADAVHEVNLQTGVIGPEIPVGARPAAVLVSRGWPDTAPW